MSDGRYDDEDEGLDNDDDCGEYDIGPGFDTVLGCCLSVTV